MNRRTFLGVTGAGVAGGLLLPDVAESSAAVPLDGMGMLVDTTECIGCRKCEYACAHEHHLTELPVEAYEDEQVFDASRRMTANAFTVVNRYPNPANPEKPIHVKSQCMHCLDPACASACLVGAIRGEENGTVSYDAGKCMGCRYCMVACPFQVPAYEYDNALTPKVQKCSFCFERVANEGKIPACAEMCPPMCLTFGNRSELLQVARDKIAADPGRYEDHIYGEHEVGGTSWLYLAGRPFAELGFLKLGTSAPPRLIEQIQHSIFRFGALPAMLFGLLGATMWNLRSEPNPAEASVKESDNTA